MSEECLAGAQWIVWFRETGFLSNCGIAAPTAALQVYRGSLSKNARRMTSVSARSSASACTRRLLLVTS